MKINKIRFISLSLIFTAFFVFYFISANILLSSNSIFDKSNSYNSTHTEINLKNRNIDEEKFNNMIVELDEYLDNYLGIEWYKNEYIGSGSGSHIEIYNNDNDINNYDVLYGKDLEDLELFDIALNEASFAFANDALGLNYEIGGKVRIYNTIYNIASVLDNVHKSTTSYNSYGLSSDGASESTHIYYVDKNTYEIAKSKEDDSLIGLKYRVKFEDYSIAAEKELMSGLNKTFNNEISMFPYYEILEANAGTNRLMLVASIVSTVLSLMVIFVLLLVIVFNDVKRNSTNIYIFRSLGLKNKEIVKKIMNEKYIILMISLVLSYLFFIGYFVLFNTYQYQAFFSKNISNYILATFIILVILVIYFIALESYLKFNLEKITSKKGNYNKRKANIKLLNLNIAIKLNSLKRKSANIVINVFTILMILILLTVASSISNIYTVDNYGLNYDIHAKIKYETYEKIEEYVDEVLFVRDVSKKYVYNYELDDFLKVEYKNLIGPVDSFIDVENGNLDESETTAIVSNKVLSLLNASVLDGKEYSSDNILRYYDNDEISDIYINASTTILDNEGLVIYNVTGSDYQIEYEGEYYSIVRYMNAFFKTYNFSEIYIKLNDVNELETVLKIINNDQGGNFVINTKLNLEALVYYSQGTTTDLFRVFLNALLYIIILFLIIFNFEDIYSKFYDNKNNFTILNSLSYKEKDIIALQLINKSIEFLFIALITSFIYFAIIDNVVEYVGGLLYVNYLNANYVNIGFVYVVYFVIVSILTIVFSRKMRGVYDKRV